MSRKNRGSGSGICWLLCLGMPFLPIAPASAQTVVATVPVGGSPGAVAVNPVSNKIYVADSNDVTVIDGATNSPTTVTDPNAFGPVAVAVNSVTNKIYVANMGIPTKNVRGNVTVIDGATNSTTTVTDPDAAFPSAVALNPVTNKIYVTNAQNVTVIDGATNSITTVTDPNACCPVAVAVNPVTNKIYVANKNSGNVTVIDGATNSTTTVTDPNAITPVAVAVNSATNQIYVANEGDYPGGNHGNVIVIDGATNSTTTVTDPNAVSPDGVAVDPVTNQIYVTNRCCSALSGHSGVTVINGATNSITTVTDPNAIGPIAVAVNPVTNNIYVANEDSANVTVISETTVPSNFTLSVLSAGTGSGIVSSNPAGIDCPTSCSASFPTGSTVILTALPDSGYLFSGWSGTCSGTGTCAVTMNAAASATATFATEDFWLTPASTTLMLQPGAQKTDVMTMDGLNGPFGSAIQLTCSVTGPAPLPTCAFSAASVTPGANSVTSTLTITAPATAAMRLPSRHPQLSALMYAVWLPLVFGITVVGGSKKIPRHHWILYGLLAVMLISQMACGGGSSNSNGTVNQGPTNYMVTVTGTSGAIQHTTQVTVTVQ